jgi:hypothetical protein
MAQHLDDLAESFLMSALHNGCLRSMKCHYKIDADDLRVIRPLAYVRETEVEAFSEGNSLPIVSETCPACFEAPKERYRIKCLLATQEALFPTLFHSLLRTLLPLTEPQVEDLLRLRREGYGRINGPPHVPPPMQPPSVQDEEAARRTQATHGQYDARKIWSDSLAISRQRLASGGRGCSLGQGSGQGGRAAPSEEEDERALKWGGRGDADAEEPSHKHKVVRGQGKSRARGSEAAAAAAAAESGGEGRGPTWWRRDPWLAVALAVSLGTVVVASARRT